MQTSTFSKWNLTKLSKIIKSNFCQYIFGLNHVIIYNNIARDSFLLVMIHSFLRVMIRTSAKQKIGGKHIVLTYEALRGNRMFFYMTHISPILRLEPFGIFFTQNLVTQLCTHCKLKRLTFNQKRVWNRWFNFETRCTRLKYFKTSQTS